MNQGIKYVQLSDKDIASFYEGNYKIDMQTNQYLFIKDKDDKIIERMRFDGKDTVPLKFTGIRNYRFGETKPINWEQQALFDLLQNKKITVKQITGVAGSGKNYCAFIYALNEIDHFDKNTSPYKKIVMVRNNVEVKDSSALGALPAGINEKLLPYAMPAADLLGSQTELFRLLADEKIELLHLGFARGRSFDNSIIIVDEAENLTAEHVALLVSRVGKDSVILFLGDLLQVDKMVFEKNSGLERLNRLTGNPLYGAVHLLTSERSETARLAQILY